MRSIEHRLSVLVISTAVPGSVPPLSFVALAARLENDTCQVKGAFL